jgi:hypothetical protein
MESQLVSLKLKLPDRLTFIQLIYMSIRHHQAGRIYERPFQSRGPGIV